MEGGRYAGMDGWMEGWSEGATETQNLEGRLAEYSRDGLAARGVCGEPIN